jgi:hypothetical protein
VLNKLAARFAATKAATLTTLCAALVLLAASACGGRATGEDSITAVEIDRHQPGLVEIGEVTFWAGFDLDMADPAFGGLSGLEINQDGTQLTAVSDTGRWLTADLQHNAEGRLIGLSNLAIVPMLDTDGRAIPDLPGDQSKTRGDAEALADDGAGGFLVGFERNDRVLDYASFDVLPVPLDLPAGVARLRLNSALEAVTYLADGRLLLIAEAPAPGASDIDAWIREADGWRALTYIVRDGFNVTDVAALDDGRVIVLERWFVAPFFLKIRLREITPDMLDTGAPLDGRIIATFTNSLLIDNFEGLAARPAPDGGTLLYMISDDNFSGHQRTLLYQLYLAPA